MSVSPQKYPLAEVPAGPVPPAGGPHVAETLVLLTHDASLIEALTDVVPADGLTVVGDESALAHQLLCGAAGVAFIDAAALDSRPGIAGQLTQRLHNQLPDVVLVVAGDGSAQTELAPLVTDGTIYRFVHKPVSAQRVKLFVDAAWRKREGLSGASGLYPALSMPPLPPIEPMRRPVPWPALGAALVVVAAAVAWFRLPAGSSTEAVRMPAPVPAPIAAPAPPPPARPFVRRHTEPVAATVAAEPQTVLVVARRPTPAASAPVASIPVATISSTEELIGAPSSTPPVSEARDRLSVAAITLQRVYAPDPEFPELAREQDLAGYVDLEFTVNPDGSVADVTVLKSRPAGVFESSAVAAVSRWRYRPIARDGVPISEHARLRLNFGYR